MSFHYMRIPSFDCDTPDCRASFEGTVGTGYVEARAWAIEEGWEVPRRGPTRCPDHAKDAAEVGS